MIPITMRMNPSKKMELPINSPTRRQMVAIVFGIVVLAILVNLRYGTDTAINPTMTTTIKEPTTTSIPAIPEFSGDTTKLKGTVAFALKDDEPKIPGGYVIKGLELTVKNISVYSSEGEWVKVFEGSKSLDILDYTGSIAVIGQKNIEEGKYEKIKIEMVDGSVWITNFYLHIYSPKQYAMLIPKETTVSHILRVRPDETVTVILDFDVEKSVSRSIDVENYMYILNPVITVLEESGIPDNAVMI